MRDLLPNIEAWRRDGRRVAIATVVKVWGSAPRPLGSKMAITADGDIAGSVSGGCVEGAVVEEARAVLVTGTPKLLEYGVDQETAWSVGLPCGGKIGIYVEALLETSDARQEAMREDVFEALRRDLEDDRLVAVATVLDGPEPLRGRKLLLRPDGSNVGELPSVKLEEVVRERAAEGFRSFASARFSARLEEGEADLFLEIHPPREKLVIVGAVHVAIPLVRFAHELGFRTIVVDPRTAFATEERFGHADELRTDWPDKALDEIGLTESTYLALLSHDLKLDIPALQKALPSPARYIGALGSKRTHAKRLAALAEAGVPTELGERIHNPIGFDLGGRRAEEMAAAILAELVAVRHGRGLKPPPA